MQQAVVSSSAQQLEIVRVLETSSDAAGARVSQGLWFCVVVDGDVSGSRIQTGRSHWRPLIFSIMSSSRHPGEYSTGACSHRSSALTGSVARASRDATPSVALWVAWRTALTQGEASGMCTKCCKNSRPIFEKFTAAVAFSNVKLQPELLAISRSLRGGP